MNRRIRDPYVRWCERFSPSVFTGGAAYSIVSCSSSHLDLFSLPKCPSSQHNSTDAPKSERPAKTKSRKNICPLFCTLFVPKTDLFLKNCHKPCTLLFVFSGFSPSARFTGLSVPGEIQCCVREGVFWLARCFFKERFFFK